MTTRFQERPSLSIRLLLLALCLLFTSPLWAQTTPRYAVKPAASDGIYFVSDNGNNSFDGRSWGSAFLTVAAAETACGSVNPCKIFVASQFSGTIPATPTSDNITIVAMGGEEWLSEGTYSNTQTNQYLKSIVGNISVATEFSQFGGSHSTEGFTAGLGIPSTSTVFQGDALAFYGTNASTTTNAVGLYGQMRCTANSTSCWGANEVVGDSGGLTSGVTYIGHELDVGTNSPTTAYNGVFGFSSVIAGTGSTGFVGGSAAFNASGNAPNKSWDIGFASADARANMAFRAGATCTTGTCNSESFAARSFNSSVLVNGSFVLTNAGIWDFAQPIALASSGGGTITHQAPNTAASITVTDPVATTPTPVAGSCTMTTTTCTVTVVSGAAHCMVTDNSASHISGGCAISGTTLTVTAASSNTDTWAVLWW